MEAKTESGESPEQSQSTMKSPSSILKQLKGSIF